MIFGPVALDKAEGAVLAHSVKVGTLYMKKGRLLSDADILLMAKVGILEVVVARLEENDIDEDTAANALANACRGAGASCQQAFTGRCNIYADNAGLLILDPERVHSLNCIDESITIATLGPNEAVEAGQMLATIKIIPFATSRNAIDEAIAIANEGSPLVEISPYRSHRAGLIMTSLPVTKTKVLEKTSAVLRDRLERLGSLVVDEQRCHHIADDVAVAVRRQLNQGLDPILIFGASAITDRKDEVPAGIVAAGGEISHFGMPVDPGNLLLLANHGNTTLIGLPGCARSPKLNGFDWVLERLLANRPLNSNEINRMGAGGLLKEISVRPQLRAGDNIGVTPRVPRIAALILAAGQSRRMGVANKLLAEIDGKAMLARVVEAGVASQITQIIVVTGHDHETVSLVLSPYNITNVHNSDFGDGISTSLQTGLNALSNDIDGVVILLGDMPRITSGHIDRLIAAFNPLEGRDICVPTYQGKRGNPVLFSASFFAEMAQVAGDSGAKHLIGQHEDVIVEVPMEDEGIFLDVDTPDALKAIRAAGVD